MSPRPGRGRAAWLALASCVAWSATGCVTTYENVSLADAPTREALQAQPSVTIPFGEHGAADNEFVRFYQRVFERMQEAVADHDVAQLEALLASYDRADLPEGIRARVVGYRAVLGGLRFVVGARAVVALTPKPVDDGALPSRIGDPVHFTLRLPALADPYELGGADDEDAFALAFAYEVTDTFPDGNTEERKERVLVRLPEPLLLRGGAELRLDLPVDVPVRPSVHRVVRVRVDSVPCSVRTALGPVPLAPMLLARASLDLWPKGHEAVQKAPLEHLRKALAAFDTRNFACAYLAAVYAPASERGTVIELLMEQVRFGRDDQAQVAMAALKAVTAAEPSIGDRDAWLAWWQARR